jgi:hypothetical protein
MRGPAESGMLSSLPHREHSKYRPPSSFVRLTHLCIPTLHRHEVPVPTSEGLSMCDSLGIDDAAAPRQPEGFGRYADSDVRGRPRSGRRDGHGLRTA